MPVPRKSWSNQDVIEGPQLRGAAACSSPCQFHNPTREPFSNEFINY